MDDTYPAPREVPAGQVLVADADPEEFKVNRSRIRIVEQMPPRQNFPGRAYIYGTIKLIWSSPGWIIAGARMIWTNGNWSVAWNQIDGTKHGQDFPLSDEGEIQARAAFRRRVDSGEPPV